MEGAQIGQRAHRDDAECEQEDQPGAGELLAWCQRRGSRFDGRQLGLRRDLGLRHMAVGGRERVERRAQIARQAPRRSGRRSWVMPKSARATRAANAGVPAASASASRNAARRAAGLASTGVAEHRQGQGERDGRGDRAGADRPRLVELQRR